MQNVARDTKSNVSPLCYTKKKSLPKSPFKKFLPPMFCIVIDPEAASFPTNPNALCPNCSYNKDPVSWRTQKHEASVYTRNTIMTSTTVLEIPRMLPYLLHWQSSKGDEQNTGKILTQMSREFWWEKEKVQGYKQAQLYLNIK